MNKIDRCLQEVICPREIQEQVMQQMSLNFDESIVGTAENPDNTNAEGFRLHTFLK